MIFMESLCYMQDAMFVGLVLVADDRVSVCVVWFCIVIAVNHFPHVPWDAE